MIQVGDVIRHKAFMDVAVQVFFINKHPETGLVSIQGMWMNQGGDHSYNIGYPAEFTIKPEHMNNWFRCKVPDSQSLRHEQWERLK